MSTCYTCRRREATVTGRCYKCELEFCYRCKERQQRIEELEAKNLALRGENAELLAAIASHKRNV